MNRELISQLIAQNERLIQLLHQQQDGGAQEPTTNQSHNISRAQARKMDLRTWYNRASKTMAASMSENLKQTLIRKKLGYDKHNTHTPHTAKPRHTKTTLPERRYHTPLQAHP